MVVAALFLLIGSPLLQAKQSLGKDNVPKPDLKGAVSYTIPPGPENPKFHELKVKFPPNVRKGSEDWVFNGEKDGILSILVEKEGDEAKILALQTILNMQLAIDRGEQIDGLIVARPWFGESRPHEFQTDKSRRGQVYVLFGSDPYVIVSMLASWPVGNKDAKQEALTMANCAIWTLQSTAPKN
jgi:hypothetical protein